MTLQQITIAGLFALAAAHPGAALHAAQLAGQQIGAVIAPASAERPQRRAAAEAPVAARPTPAPPSAALPVAVPAVVRPWGGLKLDLSLTPAPRKR